jgi:deazaflavin-dependent oxidoreductase (nitroreductase family)
VTDVNRSIIEEFRANEGRVGGMFEGAPLILLTTTGARSGRPHTTPAVYAEDAGRLIVFASNAGQPTSPAWLHNLRTTPTVTVERGTERFQANATEVTGPERDRLYSEQTRRNPAFADYQANTTRVIQVVALVPTRLGAAATQLKAIHAGLRRELAAVRTAAENGTPAADLRLHCLSFCTALHAHHSREDGVFPQLAKQFPDLLPALDQLADEHVAITKLNEEIRQLADTHLSPEQLTAELDRLSAELEAHFAYEEHHLGPALDAA